MERIRLLIPTKIYDSLNRLVQSVKDSIGSGGIFIVKCDSPEILREFENRLKNLQIQPHIYRPTSWEEMHDVLRTHGDDPNWGVAVWKLDLETPDELYGSIDFNRDAFLEVRWPSVFWTTSISIKKLMEKAPNFWRYRSVFVPFPPMPREPHEIAEHFDMFVKPVSEWKSPEEIERELKSLKRLLDSTDDPVRRARFLARIGKLELDLFKLRGDSGLLEKSMSHLREAISIMESHKVHDLIFAEALNDYGTALLFSVDYDRSIENFEKALEVLDNLPQDSVSSVLRAEIYNNIGSAYAHKGEYDKAIEFYNKALEIFEDLLGKYHPDTAVIYNNIGGAYRAKGEYDKAIDYLKKALEIFERRLGQCHPYTMGVLRNLAHAYRDKGEKAEFERLMAQLAELERRCKQ